MALYQRLHLLVTTLWLLALLSPSGTLSSVLPASKTPSFEHKLPNVVSHVERGCGDPLGCHGSLCINPLDDPANCCPSGGCS
ncbi:hypothetical protein PM082_007834 [Marasmius tenuissimus]|nr:hypothetical protein PM082_007834 [Marasmius tenuissimus]